MPLMVLLITNTISRPVLILGSIRIERVSLSKGYLRRSGSAVTTAITRYSFSLGVSMTGVTEVIIPFISSISAIDTGESDLRFR